MVTSKSNRSVAVLTAVALVCGATAGHAGLLTITNPSFESDTLPSGGATDNTLTGWTGSTGSPFNYGALNVTASMYAGGAPDGANVAFVQNGTAIDQSLSAVLTAGNHYTLTGFIGQRLDIAAPPQGYALLLAGGDPIAFQVLNAPTAGTFQSFSLTYFAQAGNPDLGSNLEIQFGVLNGDPGQINFDNIALDASVPEPVNVAMGIFGVLAVGGFAGRRYFATRKVNVA